MTLVEKKNLKNIFEISAFYSDSSFYLNQWKYLFLEFNEIIMHFCNKNNLLLEKFVHI